MQGLKANKQMRGRAGTEGGHGIGSSKRRRLVQPAAAPAGGQENTAPEAAAVVDELDDF